MTEQTPAPSAPQPATPLASQAPSSAPAARLRVYLVVIAILLVALAASSGTLVYMYEQKTSQLNDQLQKDSSLNTQNTNLQNQINQLQNQVNQLQSQTSQLQAELSAKPSYTLVNGTISVYGVSWAFGSVIFSGPGTGAVQTGFFYNSTRASSSYYGPLYLQAGITYNIIFAVYITTTNVYPYFTSGHCELAPTTFTPSGTVETQNFFC